MRIISHLILYVKLPLDFNSNNKQKHKGDLVHMAKVTKAIKHKKILTETLKFSGEVSQDGLYIVLDGIATPIGTLFKKLSGEVVNVTINTKQEEEIE